MMATEFRISEITSLAEVSDTGKEGARFVWTSAKTIPGDADGGARACPREVMEMGGHQVLVRTKNPGSRNPSFQILGPDYKPITLHGVWDDRYNYRGYAVQTMRDFEDMARRGNRVMVSVAAQGFIGVIEDWTFPYRRNWDIGYSFVLNIWGRNDAKITTTAAPPPKDPWTMAAGLNQQADYVAAEHARRPEKSIYAKTMQAINQGLGEVSVGLNAVSKALDTRTGVLSPIGDFKNLATQFRSIQGNCSTVLNSMVSVRSDVDMTYRTGKDVLDFEAWGKSMAGQLRLLRHGSRQAAVACDQRDIACTVGSYRPRKGQSLYSVSQDCYQTPFGWKAIYDANHLHSTTLLGTETLIIPARGVTV